MLQFFKSIAVSHEGPGQGLVFTTSARRNCADNTFCLLNGHSFFPLLLLIFIPDQQGWMGSRPTIRRNDACGGKKTFHICWMWFCLHVEPGTTLPTWDNKGRYWQDTEDGDGKGGKALGFITAFWAAAPQLDPLCLWTSCGGNNSPYFFFRWTLKKSICFPITIDMQYYVSPRCAM